MTDLRNALKRASETSESEALDHGAVSQKVQRVIRRRRAMYAAGAGLFVLVVGFSAFQIAEGNWLGNSTDGGGVSTAPDEAQLVFKTKPKIATAGDEISFTLKNNGESAISVEPSWELHGPGETEFSGTSSYDRTEIAPNDAAQVGPDSEVFKEPGAYSLTLTVRLEDGSQETFHSIFTVAPEPEPELEPIVVEMPTADVANAGIQSPVRIAGTADVYEGTVSVRIKDDAGNVLAEEFTTATCGSGCRGDFSIDVAFTVDGPVAGVIEVYSESAETGEPMHMVEIPANLLPPKSEETPDEGEQAAITVESHQSGDLMTAPSTVVSGTANTFEANVRIRLLDENGEILVDTFTTATCGTGCRGDYSKRIKFQVDQQQSGTLQVFESSAKDGSDINMVEIPVVLAPN